MAFLCIHIPPKQTIQGLKIRNRQSPSSPRIRNRQSCTGSGMARASKEQIRAHKGLCRSWALSTLIVLQVVFVETCTTHRAKHAQVDCMWIAQVLSCRTGWQPASCLSFSCLSIVVNSHRYGRTRPSDAPHALPCWASEGSWISCHSTISTVYTCHLQPFFLKKFEGVY